MRLARHCLSAIILALIVGGHVRSTAATPKSPQKVRASLVSSETSVQPGRPITVALRLQHDPHWHTYWLNPGTGLPTTLAWKLPPGWNAGPIQWPAPIVLRDVAGGITGHGYEKEILLPVVLTPPATLAPGSRIDLQAAAEWLMCEEICVPGGESVSLSLPVTIESPQPDPAWGTKIRDTIARLPRADPAWRVTALRQGETITLTVSPSGGAAPAHTPTGLHFFTADGLVAYDQPQTLSSDGRGGFVLSLKADATAAAGTKTLSGVLTAKNGWKADGTLPGLAISADLSAAAPAAPAAASSSLPGTLLLAFLGGLILNLMPCVFPVLGIKILGFVNQAGQQRGRVVAHGLVFTSGVLASFWMLATALALLRAGGDQLGWGFQLQSAPFVYTLAVLLLVFGLNLSGVFEFGLGATAVGGNLQSKDGYAGSFFTGVLATVVATPCSAPFLAPALGAALAVSTTESFIIFSAIALGLSTPYLLLSIFPQAIKILPRPGAWMETFKQFMAFPLYATVGYLLWVLAGQTNEEGLLQTILGLVLVAMAVWIYGRWNAPGASAGRARFGIVGLAMVGTLALWTGWPRSASAEDAPVTWEAWSPEAVARLRAEGRTLYVDFTARWCATCQTNKKLVFGSSEVRRYFSEKKIATLRADWTNKDSRITAELARHGRSAVPFNMIWLPGRPDPVLLPELLTPGVVLEALRGK